jgi:hypothetical protein
MHDGFRRSIRIEMGIRGDFLRERDIAAPPIEEQSERSVDHFDENWWIYSSAVSDDVPRCQRIWLRTKYALPEYCGRQDRFASKEEVH